MKTGGRVKGTANKITQDVKSAVLLLLSNNMDKLQDDIDKLPPDKRIDVMLRLISYAIPKPLPQIDTMQKSIEFVITKGDTIL